MRFTCARIRVPGEEAVDLADVLSPATGGKVLPTRALAPYVTRCGGARSSMVRAGRS
jgi:hypothetical protein